MAPQVRPTDGTLPPLVAFGGRIDRATLKPHAKQATMAGCSPGIGGTQGGLGDAAGPRATSGAMATGGNLVFMGNSGGNELAAYNAKNGTKLWNFDALTAVYAAPITYELNGVQYIAASVGGRRPATISRPRTRACWCSRSGGNAKLPPYSPTRPGTQSAALTAAADVVERGGKVYEQHCSVCTA